MTVYVFDVLEQMARELDTLVSGEATGGSTTTIVDPTLSSQGWEADRFIGGTAFLIRDAGGAGAAPEKQSRVVTGYSKTSGTLTVLPAFTAAVAAGDWYAVGGPNFPRGDLVDKLIGALKEIGDVPTEDTSITTLANTLEYSLPAAAKKDLREVWIARNAAEPYGWVRELLAQVRYSGVDVAAKLALPYFPTPGRKIKLVYMAGHPLVSADAGKISEYVSVDWLALRAAVAACRWRLRQPGSDDKALTAQLNDLMQREQIARRNRIRQIPASQPVLPAW
jgi:hypothetical protein